MLLLWQNRGLPFTMLATASYTSKNGHISMMSQQFCEAFSAQQVQDQIKWATASQINIGISNFQDILRTMYFPSRCLVFDLELDWIQIYTLKMLQKPLMKRLAPCRDMSILFSAFCPFLTNCSGPYHASFCMILGSFKYYMLPENTPKDRLQNSWHLVDICQFLFSSFSLLLTNCSGPYHRPFSMT